MRSFSEKNSAFKLQKIIPFKSNKYKKIFEIILYYFNKEKCYTILYCILFYSYTMYILYNYIMSIKNPK